MEHRKPVGLRSDDLNPDVKDALRAARQLGFAAVELSVDNPQVAPEAISESGRRHLERLIRSNGLDFAAIAGESHCTGLADASHVDEIIERSGRTLQLAADMHVPVVSHDVGDLLGLSDRERETALAALREVAARADRYGTIYAVRSRLTDPADLARLIDGVDSELLRIAIDPGALLMAGFDPNESVACFGKRIIHAYVRDASRGTSEHAGQETALGAGRLELDAYVAALHAGGYRRPFIIRRASSLNPARDLAHDRDQLAVHLLTP